MRKQIRCFDSDGVRKSLSPKSIAGFNYTIEAMGGMTDFTMEVKGTTVEDTNISIGDRIELYVGDKTLVLKYRGYVTEKNPSEDEPTNITIVGYSRMIDLTRVVLDVRFQYAIDTDLSIIFAEIGAQVQQRHTDIVIDIETVNVTLDTYDTRNKTAEEAINGLIEFASSKVRYGFDVDANGFDRLYLRNIDTTSTAVADIVVGLEEPIVNSRSQRRSISDLFNVAIVKGGTPKYPQLLPNGSFEVLRRITDNDGNLMTNPGFENGTTDWVFSGGASIKSDQEGSKPHSGENAAEIDSSGEKITQTDTTPAITIRAGTPYLLAFYAQPEIDVNIGTPPVITYRISWLNGGGTVIDYVEDTMTIVERYWKRVELISYTPTGVVGYKVEVSINSGTTNNDGVWLDDFVLADASTVYADRWGTKLNGAATINTISWNQTVSPYHGHNYLAIRCFATAADNNDVEILNYPQNRIEVIAGQSLKFSCRIKSMFATETPNILNLFIRWMDDDSGNDDDDGTDDTTYAPHRYVYTPGGPLTDWTYISTTVTVPNNVTKAIPIIRLRNTSGILIDAVSLRNSADTSSEYLEEGNLSIRLYANDLVAEVDNYDVHHSIDVFGMRDKILDSEATTLEEATAIATESIINASRLLPEPKLEFKNDTREWFTDKTVRFNGRNFASWQDGVMPVVMINGSLSGDDFIQSIEFMRKRPTTEDILRRLQQKTKRNIFGLSSDGISGGARGSGAPGPAGLPNIIQNEGTPLTSRSVMNFTGTGVNATDTGTVIEVTIDSFEEGPGGRLYLWANYI